MNSNVNSKATRNKAAKTELRAARFMVMAPQAAIINTTVAKANATMAKANGEAQVESMAKVLDDLAIDCLRFSMHFFYPIQQCAQQVYHTAVPLSPTSSPLHKYCLQSVIDNHLSHVTTFSGAPSNWGMLLRTIDIRPSQLTCTAAPAQRIIAACKDVVNIYDAITFVLQQSICIPEMVTKIEGSSDGSILFFAHSFSVTMWDVQTGGLIKTLTTQSKVNDIVVSDTGRDITYGLSDGSVISCNTHTNEGRGFGNGQPVVAICWLPWRELVAVATQNSVYIGKTTAVYTSNSLAIPGCVWGMVHLGNGELLLGTSLPGAGVDQELCTLNIVSFKHPRAMEPPTYLGRLTHQRTLQRWQPTESPTHCGWLVCPTRVGKMIVCITPPSGAKLFNTKSHNWTNNPLLLNAATSVAVSLGRNLVAQTKDSIQIFSLEVLTTGEPPDKVRPSHIYPLGENHVICVLQPTRQLTLLELETMQELHPDNDDLPLLPLFMRPLSFRSSLVNQSPSPHTSASCGSVVGFDISLAMQAWRSGTPVPEWRKATEEDVLLSGFSPEGTRVITIYNLPQPELRIKDAQCGVTLATLPLEHDGLGKVYDLTFDSETRFYLKIDGPEWHVQIPYDVIAPPSEHHPYTITKGEPVPLSKPLPAPSYTLDANCEWVVDAKFRKICWIPPGNVRRGKGGHFWSGLSLVMVGDDGVVRKLSFK